MSAWPKSLGEAPRVSDEVIERLKHTETATVLFLLMARGIGRKYGYGPIWMEGVRTLAPGRRMVGRAVTLRNLPSRPDLQQLIAVSSTAEGMNDTPRWRAVEACAPGDVLVSDAIGQSNVSVGGEIVFMRLKQRGAAGLVTDGAVRDAPNVVNFGLPVFAGGSTPTVGETRIMPFEVNVPIQCGKVLVWPGDVVMGADDGVVVIPASLAEEIATEAERHDDVERAIMDYVEREKASPSRFYPFNDLTFELYERYKQARDS
ncbi:MAG: hypothetical protein KF813_04615 [Trueperaceae bacterium]|nr:hypothetical protein [Trueperaceae bacterium]